MKDESKGNMEMYPLPIDEAIQGFTLFSPAMTSIFLDKRYTAYTLEALSVMEVDDGMLEEMEVRIEDNRRRGDGKRGAVFDALVSFPSHLIDIEIQKLREGDEIPRSTFYMGKLATELERGVRHIPKRRLISLWICDFNPFSHMGKDLPYYVFESVYKRTEGIEGEDDAFDFGNGVRYIFINGAFDWGELEKRRELTAAEKALKTYVVDMRQVSADNIVNEIAREAFCGSKERGSMVYSKMQSYLYHEYKDFYDNVAKEYEEKGKEQERIAMVKSLFSQGIALDVISKASGLTEKEIFSVCKE